MVSPNESPSDEGGGGGRGGGGGGGQISIKLTHLCAKRSINCLKNVINIIIRLIFIIILYKNKNTAQVENITVTYRVSYYYYYLYILHNNRTNVHRSASTTVPDRTRVINVRPTSAN